MSTRILCYHEIEPAGAAAFARQLDFMQTRSGGIAPLSVNGVRSPVDAITVSFDDGDATIAEVAQPVLDARGIRAMLYVVTSFVQHARFHNGREWRRALNWDQLGRWLEAGHQVGSHTHTHANLPRCSRQQIVDELENSRALLQARLGLRVQHLAYPWGQHDARVLGVVAAVGGFATAASIDRGANASDTPALALRRDLADPSMGVAGLRMRLALGSCGSLYRAVRRLRQRPIAALPEAAMPGSVRAPAGRVLIPPIGSAR